jgi:hypothetical protein
VRSSWFSRRFLLGRSLFLPVSSVVSSSVVL